MERARSNDTPIFIVASAGTPQGQRHWIPDPAGMTGKLRAA
jgi:hypothetical protein